MNSKKRSGDGAFCTPAKEGTEHLEERVQALTLRNPTDGLDGAQELLRARHEREAALAADQDRTEQLKSENVKKNLSLSGL